MTRPEWRVQDCMEYNAWYCQGLSVRPSVCQTRTLLTKRKKLVPTFLCRMKEVFFQQKDWLVNL